MLSAIKLVVTENGKLLNTVTKDTNTQPTDLIKSLEEFQQLTNDTLTNLIIQRGGENSGDILEDGEENDDDTADEQVSPRKKRK